MMSYINNYRDAIDYFNIMTDQDDASMMSGFAGFVPSLKYQFGLTYGNATRAILDTDPSMKKGRKQREYQRLLAEAIAARKEKAAASVLSDADGDAHVWKSQAKVNIF
jgi:hypothetical protein